MAGIQEATAAAAELGIVLVSGQRTYIRLPPHVPFNAAAVHAPHGHYTNLRTRAAQSSNQLPRANGK